MSLRDCLSALALIALIGFANAMCSDADDYAAPTAAHIERACKGELMRKST